MTGAGAAGRRVFALAAGLAVLGPGVSSLAAQTNEADLTVPPGFRIAAFADGLPGVAGLAFGPDGRLYASRFDHGEVVVLPDGDGDGRADSAVTVIGGLDSPSAIAWHGRALWVAERTRVVRLDGTAPADTSELAVMIDGLPQSSRTGHAMVFEPGGRGFLLSVGSSCDVCQEDDPRLATILRFELDGSGEPARGGDGEGEEIRARGLRRVGGLAFHPATGELWATESGRDGLGAFLPPDELNAVRSGGHYGWPYCYGNRIPVPEHADAARCAASEPPIYTFDAHSGPAGIAFYDGSMFPEAYRGDAFVALRGSGTGSTRGGKVVRLRLRAGRPVGEEDFVGGWRAAGGEVRGRPLQPLVGPDGALYVSDDRRGRIWRITYGVDASSADPGNR